MVSTKRKYITYDIFRMNRQFFTKSWLQWEEIWIKMKLWNWKDISILIEFETPRHQKKREYI